METKSSRKESGFQAKMPLIKLIGAANLQSPVKVRKFLPLCHRNAILGCVLTNAIIIIVIFIITIIIVIDIINIMNNNDSINNNNNNNEKNRAK